MSRRTQGVLLRASRYDADNLAVARLVLANPEAHPVCTVAWARAFLRRVGDEPENRQRTFAFDEGKESRRRSLLRRADVGEAGSGTLASPARRGTAR